MSQSEEAERGGGRIYWFEPSGKSAPAGAAKRLIDLGLIRPSGDCLLPGFDQTYRLAS